MPHFPRPIFALLPVAMLACGSDPGNDTGVIDLTSCTVAATLPIALDVGQYRIVDPVHESSCVSLPASSSAQEYVVAAYSGYGASSADGTWEAYALQSLVNGATAGLLGPGPQSVRSVASSAASRFDQGLRVAERGLAAQVTRGAASRLPPASVPSVGDRDSFYVCAAADCTTFHRIGATVKYVGAPAIVYLDDQQAAGAEPFVAGDLVQLGQLFDNYLYAADTTAFGRESDINNDQHIAILMTPQVNALTSNCSSGRVVGYTFGKDLIPLSSHSNAREMFYTFSTSVATSSCAAVTRASALEALPSTLIHELQHMISFNQHVLLRSGVDQDVWLNEGLSHFAEELGWRTVPGSQCGGDCFSIYMSGDFGNAYAYLNNPEGEFLIAPESGDGTLPERGAAWLFIRWLADHFSTDSTLGTQFTRGLEQSTVLGAARISQLTGAEFPTLVGQWQLANWTSDLPGFPQDGILTYRSWDFRNLFALNYPGEFAKIFPLTPDSTSARYDHPGTLYAGSGRMVRYRLPAGSPGVTIRMSGSRTDGPLSSAIVPRLAIVRVQ
jgi:hypothetical protein